jgi:hypothetical protein
MTLLSKLLVEALNLSSWRSRVQNSSVVRVAAKTGNVTLHSIPFVAGVIGGLLQYAAWQKMAEDKSTTLSQDALEAMSRMYVGMTGLAATIADLSGKGLGKIAAMRRLSLNWGLGFKIIGEGFEWLAKVVGMGAAIVVAGWDVYQAENARSEGNRGLAFLYLTSAVIGVTASWLLIYSTLACASFVGLILVGLLIGITIIIEYLKDNKLQDWLERTIWGVKDKEHRYKNLNQEIEQLNRVRA